MLSKLYAYLNSLPLQTPTFKRFRFVGRGRGLGGVGGGELLIRHRVSATIYRSIANIGVLPPLSI